MNMNAAARPFSGTMDLDEFMAFLETRPDGEHWELIEGVAVMMAPASYAHRRITRNFCELLNGACAAGNVDLFAYFDVGVRSPGVRNFQPNRTRSSCRVLLVPTFIPKISNWPQKYHRHRILAPRLV
jgi:hypothetical protein